MALLETIDEPRDLDGLSRDQLVELSGEIRRFLVDKVSQTGGHLGPNLGVVELTIAIHRVFDSPNDVILFDTGHQTYVHKILTGRRAGFDTLRQSGGMSGYPCRAESPHDVIENSHASTALAYADGIAKAFELRGELSSGGSSGRHVVAVVGDGALTGGMAWEALNNIAGSNRQVIIVVNDNERSYAPTIGGLASHLATLRTTAGYEQTLKWGKRLMLRTPYVGNTGYSALHGMKKGVKDFLAPQGLFEDLGLKYVGPVDGHSV
ncbi:MAG: 1-deoxy-D-xylulose-5-phosphate synthase N-terminal domain-containing protein, partial [Actinomycetes bacterium]